MMALTNVLCLLVAFAVVSAGAFVPSTVLSSRARHEQLLIIRPPSSRFSPALLLAVPSSLSSSEIFLLSFDGTVAQTTEYRISVGIDLAFAAWPHLKDLAVIASAEADPAGTDSHNNQHEWLRNKMRALSHVLVSRPDVSLTCDYALLARLLMEEQELDGFRSNGSRGKYGSKFHPQTSPSSKSTDSSSPSARQTRPLTVGEIASNWDKGGCIGETVLTKYHVNYKNPLPMLQEKVEELMAEREYDIPQIHEAVMDVLQYSNVIITLGHSSDLPMAKKTLSTANMEPCAISVGDESLFCSDDDIIDQSRANERAVKLVPIRSTNAAFYEDILKQAPSSSTVYVFESSWHALEQSISLFGDNIPRGTGMAKTILGRDMQLSLNFPAWSSPVGSSQSGSSSSSSDSDRLPDGVAGLGQAKQQNEALMNVWTNLVSEDEMSELLSARIVGSSRWPS